MPERGLDNKPNSNSSSHDNDSICRQHCQYLLTFTFGRSNESNDKKMPSGCGSDSKRQARATAAAPTVAAGLAGRLFNCQLSFTQMTKIARRMRAETELQKECDSLLLLLSVAAADANVAAELRAALALRMSDRQQSDI